MKTIRIFAFPSHTTKGRTSGVDFARIIQPMNHLDGFEYEGVKFKVNMYNPKDASVSGIRWEQVAKDNDVIYFNYLNNAWGFAAMGCMMRKFGRKIVLDLDDNLWGVQNDNKAYEVYHKGSEALSNFTSICNEVDYMTTTSSYLKNVICHNTLKRHEAVQVFDNAVDFDIYKYPQEFKDTDEIVLTHFGSTTHFLDLQVENFINGIDMVMKEYPNVKIMTVGAMIPKFKEMWGSRYDTAFGDQDVYKWIKNRFPKFMKQTDILVVPLEDNIYTRCKSAIKYYEASTAKIPGVWQDIRQYKQVLDGNNGLLAYHADQWHEQIKKLIDNKELRKQMGENAYADVKDAHNIKGLVKDYAKFFKKILTK